MDPATILAAAVALSQLAAKLYTENRAATQAEVDAALADVKKREETEDEDWANGSLPPPAPPVA